MFPRHCLDYLVFQPQMDMLHSRAPGWQADTTTSVVALDSPEVGSPSHPSHICFGTLSTVGIKSSSLWPEFPYSRLPSLCQEELALTPPSF